MENSNKISRSLALTPRDSAYTHGKKIHLEFNGVLVKICQYRAKYWKNSDRNIIIF